MTMNERSETTSSQETKRPHSESEAPDANAISLLLVDDDMVLASLWQTYLQGIGYRVDCCGTVADAEVLLHINHYRLLIVDIFLRDNGKILAEGGVTLISRVRLKSGFNKAAPGQLAVLAVTGAPVRSGGGFSAINSVENLTDGILHKPVRLEELGKEVARLIVLTD